MKFNIGIEIEGIFNAESLSTKIKIGNYHEGLKNVGLKKWKLERDGSLNARDFPFKYPCCIEVKSAVCKNKTDWNRAIEYFIKYFSHNGKLELSEVIAFNQSCGSHIHLSLEDNEPFFKDKAHYKQLIKARNFFFNAVKSSEIQSKELILEHYFRRASRKMTARRYERVQNCGVRYSEFNFIPELDGEGLEWRALNMRCIQTWKEFREIMEIIYKSAKRLVFLSTKYNISKTITIKPAYAKTEDFTEEIITILPAQSPQEILTEIEVY